MPRGKRAPIEYTTQFGAGIFRPKDDVEAELGELERDTVADPAATRRPSSEEAVALRDWSEGTDDAPTARPRARGGRGNDETNVGTNGRTDERTRTRHSFDVWQDQLLALSEIQVERFNRTGRKPKLGELVQEALDAYIAEQRKSPNVRTNERPYERPTR